MLNTFNAQRDSHPLHMPLARVTCTMMRCSPKATEATITPMTASLDGGTVGTPCVSWTKFDTIQLCFLYPNTSDTVAAITNTAMYLWRWTREGKKRSMRIGKENKLRLT